MLSDKKLDGGKPFDWGKISSDYAKYRDIYPDEFYQKIVSRGLCIKGQKVLDLGTGTGVLPRNMYRFGANWTGIDISENQIEQAKRLSYGMNISYRAVSAEDMDFEDNTFDAVTACQCFWYFNHIKIMPELYRVLKPGGHILVLYMAYLPFEDRIAGESEKLVLKYSPDWSGAGETMRPIDIDAVYSRCFKKVYSEEYLLNVHFTRESWNGRMKASRAIGASLTADEISAWECEHLKMLAENAPAGFDILHYGAITELEKMIL